MKKYQYQIEAANDILSNVLNNRYKGAILAACPGAGKTTISHIIINKYLQLFPHSNVVVLTEGQNALKNQYLNDLDNPNVQINFSYGEFGSDSQVEVGIPQSMNKYKKSIDLLIVDEAHRFFLAKTEQNILNQHKPKHVILLTGSPSIYNGKNEYFIHYISADSLLRKGVFNKVNLDVVRLDRKKDIENSMPLILEKINKNKNTKILIACKTIKEANEVNSYMNTHGYSSLISNSKIDSNSTNMTKFKEGKFNCLVVVDRGILGFNDPMITDIIDLKSSNNVDSSYQLFARILRKHPTEDIIKNYIRVSGNTNYNDQVKMLHKIHAIMDAFIYENFNGKNLKCSLFNF